MKKLPYLFLLPSVIILFFFQFFTWGFDINIALRHVFVENIREAWPLVGFENFIKILTDPLTHRTLINTGVFAGSCIAIQLVLGLAIAYLLFKSSTTHQSIFRPIVMLPWLVPPMFAAYAWLLLLGKDLGLINMALSALGSGEIPWLSNPTTAMLSVIIANNWWGTPFTILFMGAALTSLSPDVLESARIDGAGGWKIFRYIVLPILVPFILINLILITVWTVNGFALIYLMTGGGPLYGTRVFPLHGYLTAFDYGNFSGGAVIAIMLVLVNLVLAFAYIKKSGGLEFLRR